MNVVFVTQRIDPGDPALGFVVPQLEHLARHVDRLVTIANEVRPGTTVRGVEVRSLGKEAGRGRVGRGSRYLVELADVLRTLRPAVLVAHMCPIYLTVAAPLARALGVPTILWYTHADDTTGLRVAGRLADRVVTALPGSCALPPEQVEAIGHAIDTDAFTATPLVRGESLRLLALGRTSPAKHYDDVIRGVARARADGVDVTLRIVGPSVTDSERAHRNELLELIAETGVSGSVTLEGPVDRRDVPEVVSAADVLVNAAEDGNADKAVFEAMACGRPVLVSSPIWEPVLDGASALLRFRAGDPESLADRITALAALPPPDLARRGEELRRRVVEDHSLEHWSRALVQVAADQLGNRHSSTHT